MSVEKLFMAIDVFLYGSFVWVMVVIVRTITYNCLGKCAEEELLANNTTTTEVSLQMVSCGICEDLYLWKDYYFDFINIKFSIKVATSKYIILWFTMKIKFYKLKKWNYMKCFFLEGISNK